MKTILKTSYIILGGTLLLASCAQEEAPAVHTDSSDRRIVFHTSLPELTTKATEIVTDLPHFFMTSFDETDTTLIVGDTLKGYFYNKKFEKESGSDKVVSDSCIWPDPGKESDKLHFFAYYPELKLGASLVNGTSVSGNDKTIGYNIEGFKVAPNIADQVDLVTAYATGSMADNLFSGINLNFRHQLSRIEIKVHGSHKSCDIEIAGVRIANVLMQGNFAFQTSNPDGAWTDVTKGKAEYIFCEGDAIVTVGSDTVSIMGSKIKGGYDNCAMLIPSTYSSWDCTNDSTNSRNGMYLNVLLRIIDKTNTTGKGSVQYPYFNTSQGLNAMNIPREYFAVDTVTNKISKRVYKNDNGYWSDAAFTQPYTLESGEKFREFGWAALPISGDWQPGYSYTYTLDYSSGVGLHGPETVGDESPKAGDPIISDRVGVSVSVNDWQGLNGTTTHTVDVPGS